MTIEQANKYKKHYKYLISECRCYIKDGVTIENGYGDAFTIQQYEDQIKHYKDQLYFIDFWIGRNIVAKDIN